MRRRLTRIATGLLLLLGIGAIVLQQAVLDLEVEELTPSVHVLTGFGGNVGVLTTSEGGVVVDTMSFALQGRRIRERVEALAGGPVQLVINSHYHLDHSHGNPGFAGAPRRGETRRRAPPRPGGRGGSEPGSPRGCSASLSPPGS